MDELVGCRNRWRNGKESSESISDIINIFLFIAVILETFPFDWCLLDRADYNNILVEVVMVKSIERLNLKQQQL